jgi:hypothetical protein
MSIFFIEDHADTEKVDPSPVIAVLDCLNRTSIDPQIETSARRFPETLYSLIATQSEYGEDYNEK